MSIRDFRKRPIKRGQRLHPSKFWGSLTRDQKASLIAIVTSAIASIIIAILVGSVGVYSYVALVLGTTISFTPDRVTRYFFENDIISRLTAIRHSEKDLQCIGGIRDGLDWICDNLSGLRIAQNTVFCRSDPEYGSADRRRVALYEHAIRDALSDECQWTDLYISSEADTIERFNASLDIDQKANYRSIRLDSSLPLFQYTILRYRNDRSAVIFGWGFAGGDDERAKVYLSENRETVDFFANNFRVLMKHYNDPNTSAHPRPPLPSPI